MGGKLGASVFVSLILVAVAFHAVEASPVYVATAQNFKGMLFTGYGPTPDHAGQMALSGCAGHSFLPITCKVIAMRAEFPPPPPPYAMRPMPKYRKSAAGGSGPSSYGPMKSTAAPQAIERPVKKPRASAPIRKPEPSEREARVSPVPAAPADPPRAVVERPGIQETSPGVGHADAKYQWGKPLHSN